MGAASARMTANRPPIAGRPRPDTFTYRSWTGRGAAAGSAVDGCQHHRRQGLERREHALAGGRDGLEVGERVDVHLLLEVLERHGVGEVALVVLDDDGEVRERPAHFPEVLLEIPHRLAV